MKHSYNNLNSNASVLVKWDRPMLERFRKAFKLAESENQDTFVFDEQGYTIGYAYYLICFLDGDLS